jgi:hypothetical protein
MLKKVLSIRMSNITWILLIFFIILVENIHQRKLTPGQLALFSVNSFLFGYYFAPLLSAQKARVASLISVARQEEMTILDILTQSHLLSSKERYQLKLRLRVYLESVIGNDKVRADNVYYDELLYYTKQAKGEDVQVMNTIYDRVSKTQANRDSMNNLFATKVYSHEWLVASVLFFITLYFALQTSVSGSLFFTLMLAILCTGLTMLMVIMIKFATLTHKEAKRMWVPLQALLDEHFDDVTPAEAAKERARVDEYLAEAKKAA